MAKGTLLLGERFTAKNIFLSLQARTREEALREILDGLAKTEQCDADDIPVLFSSLLEREKLGSTGIGPGYAIPPVKHESVGEIAVSLGISPYGLDFNSIDGEPVHHVFLILSPPDASDEYLKILQWIAKIARNADFTRFLQSATDVEEILSLLQEVSE